MLESRKNKNKYFNFSQPSIKNEDTNANKYFNFNQSSVKNQDNNIKTHEFMCGYDDCHKRYSSLNHLKRHEQVHSEGYVCDQENCERKFRTKATLKKHVNNVHLKKDPKKYKCPNCDEEFNKHNWLTRHMFRHTGIKPYVCPTEGCEKRFLHPCKLKVHMKIHEGYTCKKENCGKIFPTWTLYTRHLKIDHPTVYKCHFCEKEFSRSNNLKAHLKVHELLTEVYQCPKPNCSRFYTMKRNLIHHMKSYHEKRPFVCSQENCHKAFKSEADMIAHYSQHDPNKRKRKKKKKSKPTFAAHLAGLIPKQKQPKFKTEQKTEAEKEITIKDCTNEPEKSKDEPQFTDDENIANEENYEVDEGIKMLLNMIDERDRFNTESHLNNTKCISVKA